MRLLAGALVLIASSCGDEPQPVDLLDSSPDAVAPIEVSSPDFEEGDEIPLDHTCEGADRPPGLRWSDPPASTASFVVVVDDPDAPRGMFVHWLVAKLAPDRRDITAEPPASAVVGENDFGSTAWGGPCPPRGDGAHRYRFTVFAVDVDLDLGPGFSASALRDAMAGHVVAQGTLTGTYERGR